jgi:hypothetical protein
MLAYVGASLQLVSFYGVEFESNWARGPTIVDTSEDARAMVIITTIDIANYRFQLPVFFLLEQKASYKLT